MIDAHALRAEYVGEKDTIKKSDKAAEEARQGKDQGSGYQGMGPFFKRHKTPFLCGICSMFMRERKRIELGHEVE